MYQGADGELNPKQSHKASSTGQPITCIQWLVIFKNIIELLKNIIIMYQHTQENI